MLAAPGPVALRAAEEAERNIGVHEEGGNNVGRFVEVYQHAAGCGRGEPWCQAFVFYRLWRAAGQPKGYRMPLGYPRTASTVKAAAWAMARGVWIPARTAETTPALIRRGDLAYFYLHVIGEQGNRIAHVGITVAVDRLGVWTVEANTGPESGVRRDGDGVWRKRREWRELGLYGGFARLAF